MSYCVYLLCNNANNCTYLGITNNSDRRIRQHNGELVGGARYTRAKKGTGQWKYHLKILNLTKSESLSLERTAKNLRKRGVGKTTIDRRVSVLLPLVSKYPNAHIQYF